MLQEPARRCWWRCGMRSSWPRPREGWNKGWEVIVTTVMRCGEYVLKCVFWIFACVSWLCLLFWHFSHSIPLVRLISWSLSQVFWIVIWKAPNILGYVHCTEVLLATGVQQHPHSTSGPEGLHPEKSNITWSQPCDAGNFETGQQHQSPYQLHVEIFHCVASAPWLPFKSVLKIEKLFLCLMTFCWILP